MYNYKPIIKAANELGCKYIENEPMFRHTTFRIGGNADLFITVDSKEKLKEILACIENEKIPMFVLGRGSNILVSDSGFNGVILKLEGDFTKVSLLDDDFICCGSGVTLAKLCNEALKYSLSGLEFAWGIPGSAGGAIYMNAGAYSGEMKDVVTSCTHIDKQGKFRTYKKEKLNFSYRNSIYSKSDYIITDITIKLKKDDYESIRKRMDDFMDRRKSKQPIDIPNAGSIFKRPEGNFAGTLIEKCGLKGKTIGGAQVSTKHAGFIVNNGNAKCEDVLNLIEFIKEKVMKETGILLECEIKTI